MASIQKREGKYRVRYRDPSGRSHGRSFSRKVDADRFARAVEVDKERGDWFDPAALFQTVSAHLSHKKSAPYTPTSKHDFMHHKLLIVDQRVVVSGSRNFSANATGNAENSFTLHDPNIVQQYAAHVAQLEATY